MRNYSKMVVKVLVAKDFEGEYTSWFGRYGWQYGLLLGHLEAEAIHVAAFVPAPLDDTDNEDGHRTKDVNEISKRLKSLDNGWISQHADLVSRGLPGGLDIVGYALYCPSSINAPVKLKEAVDAITGKNVALNLLLPTYTPLPSHRVGLHVCGSSKKIAFKTIDVADAKLRLDSLLWHALHTSISTAGASRLCSM
eukprot:TRINITY_DN8209_c0_g1_i1.p3 TRINITY_DN8209_c0_g1~~TRINITY_DN8209_c0_g1_i1.p3  ORF type:complete len:195 (+),score=35.35 TRINITY_DN8209_c0_g1_i1:1579-2163(+)